MRILCLGDVVGRSGREAAIKLITKMKAQKAPDFILVNVDNAAGGWGVTKDTAEEFFKAGADCLTGGDHIWDQKEIRHYLEQEKRLLRPLNFPSINPGSGVRLFEKNGKKVLVIHVLGQVFIKDNVNCPFAAVKSELEKYRLGSGADAILVDIHAEATSEKNAMGVFCDGRVTAVFGTHTHVPTADARILPKGTGYITDLGMCGDYNGTVIGWQPQIPMDMFLTKTKQAQRMEPAAGVGKACGILLEVTSGGLPASITPFQE